MHLIKRSTRQSSASEGYFSILLDAFTDYMKWLMTKKRAGKHIKVKNDY